MSKRCALYLRVSTEQQVDGNSLATQKALLLRHAKARGYDVADLYIDAGLSGKNMNRPELQRLIQDARCQRFDLVLVWKVDRVSRSMKDLLNLIALLREYGVEFAAIDQQFDTADPIGVMTLHILGSFAQFEREMLIERTKEGHLHRVRRSDWSCGPAPYGYRKENGRLVAVPEEAKVVRRMFDLLLKVKSRRALAMGLNADGLRTRRGALWTCGTITEILRNPVYTGANVYGRRRKSDTYLKDRDKWTIVPDMRDALVGPEAFEAAQTLIAHARDAQVEKNESRTYSLKGLVRCGKCGSAMCGTSMRRSQKVHRYYRCNGSQHRGNLHCGGMMVSADLLEKAVAEKVNGPTQNAQTAQDTRETDTEERKETRRALDSLRERTARLFNLYELGQLDKTLFQERMAGLSEERDRLTASLKVNPARNGARDVPETNSAVNGIVKVVAQGRRAQVHMAGGAMSEVSLVTEGNTTTFGGRLKAWRLQEGMMQKDVARMFGVDKCSVRNWEAGRCIPRHGIQEQVLSRLPICAPGG